MSLTDNTPGRTSTPRAKLPAYPRTTERLPTGLRRLIQIGHVLAGQSWADLPSLRVVVTVPTIRLAGMAVALGASRADPQCDDRCVHTQLDGMKRLAACYWERHLQDREAWYAEDGVHVGTSVFTKSWGSVHRLPAGFPIDRGRVRRNPNSRSEEEIRDLAAAFGEDLALAGLRRSKMGAHPVLCIGNMAEVHADLNLACAVPELAALHPLGRLAPGEHYESWFRHPMIVVKRPPLHGQHGWLASVRPRLVTRVGQAALLAPMQGLWPEIPHVIVLSRRSRSSVDAIEAIRAMGWRQVIPDIQDVKKTLRPGDGLEIGCFTEPGKVLSRPADELEEDEW